MLFNAQQQTNVPRRVKVPVQEPTQNPSVSANIPALAQFFKAARDTMDFGIDFSDWLIANGSPQLKSCVYAAGADSPKPPDIESQTFSPTGETVVMLAGGDVGDAYYLDCTVVLDDVQIREGNPSTIGERTMVRRIHVVVYNG